MGLFSYWTRLLEQVAANQLTIITNQEESLKKMGTTNTTISAMAADFGKFQTDFATFATDQASLNSAIKAFLTSLASGANGTTLSAADQATLDTLDQGITAADQGVQDMDAAVKAIQIPVPPAAPAPTPAP